MQALIPQQVKYIEAHGTGTFVGDPIEANSIGKVVGNNRGRTMLYRFGKNQYRSPGTCIRYCRDY